MKKTIIKLMSGMSFVFLLLLTALPASAANFLFVSDAVESQNIATVLSGDGHTVTTVLNDYEDSTTENNIVLQGGGLAVYDAIFWVASGEGSGDEHAAATRINLEAYVNAGGRLFITGYDSVSSPDDPELVALVGFTTNYDSSSDNLSGPLIGANSLTTGVIDITGVTPTGGYSDSDSMDGALAGTICISIRPVGSDGEGLCGWSLRSLGGGEIAYVSNAECCDEGDHPSWEDTSPGGDGAYNAALRNFAANAPGVDPGPIGPTTPVPVMPIWSYGLLGLALSLLVRRRLRK
jgi:hypothetical protein